MSDTKQDNMKWLKEAAELFAADLAKEMEIKGMSGAKVSFHYDPKATKAQGGKVNCKVELVKHESLQFDCNVEGES